MRPASAKETAGWLLAVLVGGRGRRLGGLPKGRLPAPTETGEPLIERLVQMASPLGARAVLVGRADAYEDLLPDVPRLRDAPQSAGPLAGLLAALHRGRATGAPGVLLVGCDQWALSVDDLAVLQREVRHSGRPAAFEVGGRLEPLPSAWPVDDATLRAVEQRCLQGRGSLGRALRKLRVVARPGRRDVAADWDRPRDVAAALGPEVAARVLQRLARRGAS